MAASPIDKSDLTTEVARATVGTLRSPMSGYPGDGLTPVSLAAILRDADAGYATRYLDLAEAIEERDPHYLSILGTRRRSVAQLPVSVQPGGDDAKSVEDAQRVETWLSNGVLGNAIFDMLDCISKGYSATEIIWDRSEGQWTPDRLIWRQPRWFRFDRRDLETPLLLTLDNKEEPLKRGKWIFAQIKAKSGLPLRSGLARVGAWMWMFKAFTQKDWAIFSQTYGQPVRLGKYQSGASDEEKRTLFEAVRDIAGDCAAIMPASMMIEFVESGNVGVAHQLYKERCEWIDQQMSKAVLGQTSTTDAVVGGLGSGKEHREVQKDIETSDARALATILNRDLIIPWMQLNGGPRKAYPQLVIAQPEEEDLKALAEALGPMIDRGLKVDEADIRKRFGLAEPGPKAVLLRPAGPTTPAVDPTDPNSKIKRVSDEIKRGEPRLATEAALQAEGPLAGISDAPTPADLLADRMAVEAQPSIDAILARLEQMTRAASSLEELRQMVVESFPGIDVSGLADLLTTGLVAANLGGRVMVAEDAP
jgi:phage gp29-like protein